MTETVTEEMTESSYIAMHGILLLIFIFMILAVFSVKVIVPFSRERSYIKAEINRTDGAELCYGLLREKIPGIRLAPPQLRIQRGSSVGFAAQAALETSPPLTPAQLMPVYLRLPQAERELRKKEGASPIGKDDANAGTGK